MTTILLVIVLFVIQVISSTRILISKASTDDLEWNHKNRDHVRRIQANSSDNATKTTNATINCSIYSTDKKEVNVLIDFNSFLHLNRAGEDDCGCDFKCNWYNKGSMESRGKLIDVLIIVNSMNSGKISK